MFEVYYTILLNETKSNKKPYIIKFKLIIHKYRLISDDSII